MTIILTKDQLIDEVTVKIYQCPECEEHIEEWRKNCPNCHEKIKWGLSIETKIRKQIAHDINCIDWLCSYKHSREPDSFETSLNNLKEKIVKKISGEK